MMKFKKIAAAVLAAAVLAATPATVSLFSPFSVTANAEDALTEGDYKYSVNADGESVTITKYTGTDAEVDIPGSLGGKAVTKIGVDAFQECTSLTSVTIPESVTTINKYVYDQHENVFAGCTSLEKIDVAADNDYFSSIDGVLFSKDKTELLCYPGGKKAESYEIPDFVALIGGGAFYGNTSLKIVTMPNNVTTIEPRVFLYCTSLESVVLSDSLKTIPSSAFMFCTSLKNVTIPDSIRTIMNQAFQECRFTSIAIPNGVKQIYPNTFEACVKLISITIPNSVSQINDTAFIGCTSLETVNFDGTMAEWEAIEIGEYNEDLTNAEIICTDGIINERKPAPDDTSEPETSEPENSDTSEPELQPGDEFTEGDYKFTVNEDGESVTINKYKGSGGTTDVDIPAALGGMSVTALGGGNESLFTDYPAVWLTSVTISDGVTTINNSAFKYCEGLKSAAIPNSVTIIGLSAFEKCLMLETVNYGGTKAEWKAIEIDVHNEYLTNAEIICTDGIINEREPETSDTSEPTSSDTSEPETSKPITSEPETSEPTTSKPETSEPETSEPITSEPETSEPTSSDTSAPTDPDLFIKENEVSAEIEVPTEAANIPESDRITSITINPAFNMKNKNDNNVELDLSKITIKAEAIYDKEGLKRAEEALGETIKGNKHYNLLDLTLLYNGEDFSNGYEGLVQVVIPLPKGHRDKNFSCFRLTKVNGKMVKEVIPGEQTEDSYIIYLEHFSLYALVADDDEPATSDTSEPAASEPAASKPAESTVIPGGTDPAASDDNSGNNDNSGNGGSGSDQAPTGIALAITPVVLAAGAVIAAMSKKRK